MNNRLIEWLADHAMRDCKRIVYDREQAANKKFRYNTRLFYDKLAARAEDRVIEMANRIIRQIERNQG